MTLMLVLMCIYNTLFMIFIYLYIFYKPDQNNQVQKTLTPIYFPLGALSVN